MANIWAILKTSLFKKTAAQVSVWNQLEIFRLLLFQRLVTLHLDLDS